MSPADTSGLAVRRKIEPHRPDEMAFAKVLIHSPAGHGKTRLLATANDDPRTFPMAFLNFEGGTDSLIGLDIDVFDIKTKSDYDDVYRELKNPKSPYKSVGVDSITETQISFLLELLEKDTINRADPDLLAQQDWGLVLVQMRRIIRQFVKTLPMHVFMTALSKDDVVARVGSVKSPSMQGQFAHELPGIPNVVAYLALEDNPDTGEVDRILLLHDYPKFSVKVRAPVGLVVPSEIYNPTVTSLLDALGYKSE